MCGGWLGIMIFDFYVFFGCIGIIRFIRYYGRKGWDQILSDEDEVNGQVYFKYWNVFLYFFLGQLYLFLRFKYCDYIIDF